MQFLSQFAQINGPAFLALYLVCWLAFMVVCLIVRSQIDPAEPGRRVAAEVDPDPYKIAYLRGGMNEVNRLATFALFSIGALEEKKNWRGSTTWTLLPDKVDAATATPYALEATSYYRVPRKPTDIFQSDMQDKFTSQRKEWDAWIEEKELRIEPDKQFKLGAIAFSLAGLYASIGLFKIVAAVLHDRYNIGFAIVLLIVGTIGILLTRSPRRFNARGRSFLSDTQIINGQYRSLTQRDLALKPHPEDSSPGMGGIGNMPIMAMGLFGVAALEGSPYENFRKTYLKSESSGGGCGASCAGASWSSGCGSSNGQSSGAHGNSGGTHGGGGASCGGGGGASCGGSGGASCGGSGGSGCGGGGCGGS